MARPLVSSLASFMLAGCGTSDTGPDSAHDTSSIGGTDSQECITEAPDHWPGCLIMERSDPEGDGRHHDELRTLHDGLGRVVSTDRRAARDFDDWALCGNTWLDATESISEEWCIGRSAYAYTWTHDDQGHPTGKTYDAGRDGVPDREWVFETDDEGRVITSLQDQDLDGETDSINTFEYDTDGHVLREAWDYDADGVEDYIRVYTYDPDGNLLTEETDSDADGVLDDLVTWARDERGNPLERIEDENADGSVDLKTIWTWSDCKVQEVEERDIDGNRVRKTYAYDASHRRTEEMTDTNGDGVPESTRTWEYRCPF